MQLHIVLIHELLNWGEKYKEMNEFYDEELIEITEEWCRDSYAIAEDLDEANEIAENMTVSFNGGKYEKDL